MTAPAPYMPQVTTPSRYRGNIHLLRVDDRETQMARRPLPQVFREDDLSHVWRDGDYLDLLAHRYYSDPRLWWVIADFNGVTDFRVIEVGKVLRFPTLRRLTVELLG